MMGIINRLGCIYIVSFDNGLIKVGLSKTPESRIKTHAHSMSLNGVKIQSTWISDKHYNFRENEDLLILKITQHRIGESREWCRGVLFDDLVNYAKGLNFNSDPVDQDKEFSTEREDRLAAHLIPETPKPEKDETLFYVLLGKASVITTMLFNNGWIDNKLHPMSDEHPYCCYAVGLAHHAFYSDFDLEEMLFDLIYHQETGDYDKEGMILNQISIITDKLTESVNK
jgi:hypothetical protein